MGVGWSMKLALGLAALSLLASSVALARHDDAPTCEEVRKVRAFAARHGVSDGLGTLEAEICRRTTPAPRVEQYRWNPLTNAEFEEYVAGPLRRAMIKDEPAICRRVARDVLVTTEQVIQVVRAVAIANEAPCVLALYPRTVDRLAWEKVYTPMSVSAEREVRRKIDEMESSEFAEY